MPQQPGQANAARKLGAIMVQRSMLQSSIVESSPRSSDIFEDLHAARMSKSGRAAGPSITAFLEATS